MSPEAWIAIVGLALGLTYKIVDALVKYARFEAARWTALLDKVDNLVSRMGAVEAVVSTLERRQEPRALVRLAKQMARVSPSEQLSADDLCQRIIDRYGTKGGNEEAGT